MYKTLELVVLRLRMSLVKQVILLFSMYIFKYSNEDGKMTQLKRKVLMQGTQV